MRGVNVQRSLHPQYHNEVPLSKTPNPNCSPGAAALMAAHCVCVCVCVCVRLDVLNAERKFRVWVTILGHMSRNFKMHACSVLVID